MGELEEKAESRSQVNVMRLFAALDRVRQARSRRIAVLVGNGHNVLWNIAHDADASGGVIGINRLSLFGSGMILHSFHHCQTARRQGWDLYGDFYVADWGIVQHIIPVLAN